MYGLNVNKDNIKKYKYAIVFEGEKSVLKMGSWYEDSTAVAMNGSNFSEYQLEDKVLDEKLAEEAGVILNKGISFGKAGQAHARLNAAAPFSLTEEASKRLVETFKI